ncbi:hypothetical protein N7451_012588 [Penicillium sp. IBT 35674x]|nr:hypothetical protein N7451_012588 [Penicillium sp. IBT 35674x]
MDNVVVIVIAVLAASFATMHMLIRIRATSKMRSDDWMMVAAMVKFHTTLSAGIQLIGYQAFLFALFAICLVGMLSYAEPECEPIY